MDITYVKIPQIGDINIDYWNEKNVSRADGNKRNCWERDTCSTLHSVQAPNGHGKIASCKSRGRRLTLIQEDIALYNHGCGMNLILVKSCAWGKT